MREAWVQPLAHSPGVLEGELRVLLSRTREAAAGAPFRSCVSPILAFDVQSRREVDAARRFSTNKIAATRALRI